MNTVRKFEETLDVRDWLVETDKGFSPIKRIGKTIPYDVYKITTSRGRKLLCADTHILYDTEYDEVYAKDLNKGTRPDHIITEDGVEMVTKAVKLGYKCNMYDIEVDDDNHRYYANGFLCHNSIFLCNDAANFMLAGKNVLFITCEMSDKKVIKRIGANLLDISIDEYDRLSLDSEAMAKKIISFRQRQLTPIGRLFVKEYPTSCCTAIDLDNYIKQIEEVQGFKVNVVVIDYINIMRNHRSSDSANTYINIKNLAEDLRAIAVRRNCLVLTATQSNRSAFDSNDITLSQIAESMGLVATADAVFGIIQDNEQKLNYEYYLKILKIRDGFGKNNKILMHIDYKRMRLTEDDVIITEDGTALPNGAQKKKKKKKADEPVRDKSVSREPDDDDINDDDIDETEEPTQDSLDF